MASTLDLFAKLQIGTEEDYSYSPLSDKTHNHMFEHVQAEWNPMEIAIQPRTVSTYLLFLDGVLARLVPLVAVRFRIR